MEGFSKWRGRLWPVHNHEIKKLLPLLLMKFCISFNFSVLHATKDTLIVTSQYSGAEAIPVLKGWVVLFFAFLLMIVYSKLSNCLSKTKLFYVTITPFIVFFLLYGFVLYPNRDLLCPHKTADLLTSFLGAERAHIVAVYRYWMDSLFFLMAELWGGVVIALLFWGFANQINTVKEASRFYTILSAGGHIGVITAGPIIWHYAHAFTNNQFVFTIQYLMSFVTIAGLIAMAAYWWINRATIKTTEISKEKEPSTKLSIKEGLLHIIRSPYLGCIALMVIGYGMSVNMVEVIWKAILKNYYPNSNDYQAFMGIVAFITGCFSLFLAFFVGGNVIRRFGWYFGAQSTPIVLGLVSLVFVLAFFFNYHNNALFLLVICGAIHNIACKSMKYCLFDPTKEMAYIPLDIESKIKGKAAVDVVAARFGKSGSSWIQVIAMELASVGSILSVVSYLVPFILITIVCWMAAIHFLKIHQTKRSLV